MHEALSALLDYAFTELNLNPIEANTDSPERLADMAAFSLATGLRVFLTADSNAIQD